MTELAAALTALGPRLDAALAKGLAGLRAGGAWTGFELSESLEDLLRLSDREDACYDRPSSGWAYGCWYHGRRVQTALRLIGPSLLGQSGTVTIVDLGCGTGATAWAVATLASAARTTGQPFPSVHFVGVEASEPMVRAARTLWDELMCADVMAGMGSTPRFDLATWTDLAKIELPEADRQMAVGGYLFDDSDRSIGADIGRLLADCLRSARLTELLLVGSSSKNDVVTAAESTLDEAGWRTEPITPMLSPWSGPLQAVARERAEGLQGVPKFARLPRLPTWTASREAPRFYRFVHQDRSETLFELAEDRGLALDPDQHLAATPDNRMTAIIGAAGSGKSRILIERAVRATERRRSRRAARTDVLISTFNNEMIDTLVEWVEERLDRSGVSERVWTNNRDDHTVAGTRGGHRWSIRLMTWDKVPSRLFHVRPDNPRNLSEPSVDRRLAELGIDRSHLTDAQRGVLDPDFLDAELRRVIYGFGVWDDLPRYLAVERRGRRSRLSVQQKELVWRVAREGSVRTWTHYRMDGLVAAAERATIRPPAFSHVLIDECQDMTPADFQFASLLVHDPNRLVIAGDEAQAVHLGASYLRPGQMEIPEPYRRGDQVAFRLWQTHHLRGSYRLPVRLCECVRPVAEALLADRTSLSDSNDVELPEAKKPAVLGVRPIVVSRRRLLPSLKEIFLTYGELLLSAPETVRQITVAEGGVDLAELSAIAPACCRVGSAGMARIKGLERACIIWPTWQPNRSHESALEWAYTTLTRAAGLAIVAVDASAVTPETAAALTMLREDRLLYWDEEAKAEMESVRASVNRST